MSITFTKLFSSITESTIWCEDSDIRVVWITMLAMCDKNGRVWGSIPGLAKRAAVSVEKVENALEKFKSPDKYSRTQDFEGRRIEDIDGGWRLLNHAKYRAIRDEEERRIYKTAKQREYREKQKEEVDNVDRGGPQRTHTDTDTDTDTEAYTDPLDQNTIVASKLASCPHEKIITLFHETLPELPRVKTWTETRKSHLKARWREYPDIDDWKTFFNIVKKSKFLTGQISDGNRKPFRATLAWLIKPENFAKTIEGNYSG